MAGGDGKEVRAVTESKESSKDPADSDASGATGKFTLTWGKIGVLISAIPILTNLISWFAFGPMNIDGAWIAKAPGQDNTGFKGCVHFSQEWPRSSVVGSIGDADFEEQPELVGLIEQQRLEFQFMVFNTHPKTKKRVPTFGRGTLVRGARGQLHGLWRQEVGPPPANTHRWRLERASNDQCPG